jgi:hypothetical protein
MQIEVITKQDLLDFRQQLLEDLKQYLVKPTQASKQKWLKSAQVREMLNISAGTLQNLRINGTLKPTRIGGSFYYSHQDIQSLLESKK